MDSLDCRLTVMRRCIVLPRILQYFLYLNTENTARFQKFILSTWRHASVVRTSVFSWQIFPDLWL